MIMMTKDNVKIKRKVEEFLYAKFPEGPINL